jgi:chemotaxis protein MotB
VSGGPKIIVVKKRAKAHAAHHGGSWKVAYADFVTAMMAFFLVMWIMGMDEGVKDMVQGYFENPVGFKKAFSGGKTLVSQGNSIVNADIRRALILLRRQEEQERLEEAAERILDRIENSELFNENAIDVTVTSDGLRIELMESGRAGLFFEAGSSVVKPAMEEALSAIGGELRLLPELVVVEGHTDAVPLDRDGYTNWELSVDRANAARRVLLGNGLPGRRFVEVRGYADRRPKFPENPEDPRNRRITVLLPFSVPDPNVAGMTDELPAAVGSDSTIASEGGF